MATIHLAGTIAEANQKLNEQLPDLVIADIVLPDGLSLGLFTQQFIPIGRTYKKNLLRLIDLRKPIFLRS